MVARPRLDTVLGRPSIDSLEPDFSERPTSAREQPGQVSRQCCRLGRTLASVAFRDLATRQAAVAQSDAHAVRSFQLSFSVRSCARGAGFPPYLRFQVCHASAATPRPLTSRRIPNQFELHVWSQSVKMTRPPGYETPRSLPVFDTHSKISGTVLLDSGLTANPGRLTISMEGAFVYISPPSSASKTSGKVPASGMHRHVFIQSSMVVPVEQPQMTRQRSNSSLREAFTATVAPRKLRRRPSESSVASGVLRPYPFTLEVPPSGQLGEELPPTFSAVVEGLVGPRGRAYVERSEITYKLVATWEGRSDAPGGDAKLSIEAPIIFEPDRDFESLDGRSRDKDTWLEATLHPERPVPFTCAVAIPEAASFSRSSTIPYYVVFTTTPRSATLAREIVLDATITVALVRQVNIEVPPGSPISPYLSSPSLSGSDDATSVILAHKTRLLKRLVNSAPPRLPRRGLKLSFPVLGHARRTPSEVAIPPPLVEEEGYQDERTVYTDVYAGFPKRPRLRTEPGRKHPTLDATAMLPDGLYKAKMQLHPQMIPSINWADLVVKYYLEVSVVFGQDETRARVPVRIA
ncbi:uncharacterized protein B0H18DRAFT_870310 [Fomitopsis serialis]|uniref:uncharacterized protein n=1 Tax=Fomitopsis serialis TaxID=139415 RepID=UPI0020079F9C|nr:uncharacterized protein B0H18DRAFT_870310 [Neoantrodia serialis]KAH9933732.1 hypothetical protein B0H18DRAFT_870310 [Neoantrodia serialis]